MVLYFLDISLVPQIHCNIMGLMGAVIWFLSYVLIGLGFVCARCSVDVCCVLLVGGLLNLAFVRISLKFFVLLYATIGRL